MEPLWKIRSGFNGHDVSSLRHPCQEKQMTEFNKRTVQCRHHRQQVWLCLLIGSHMWAPLHQWHWVT